MRPQRRYERHEYRLTPLDPLVLGDGRPLERQRGRLWPVPATLTAAINGWIGGAAPPGVAPTVKWEETALTGPLLERRDGGLMVPAPLDARVDDKGQWIRGMFAPGKHVLWPKGFPEGLHLYQNPERGSGGGKLRPAEGPLAWEAARAWALGGVPVGDQPVLGVQQEGRIHVGIDPSSGTATDGALFPTAGLRLESGAAYVFQWEGPEIAAGLVPFGGEGRHARLERRSTALGGQSLPGVPSDLVASLPSGGGLLRVQLLTPAWFQEPDGVAAGWIPSLPGWLQTGVGVLPGTSVRAHLFAMCTDRPVAFSGWASNWRTGEATPRAVRRLVPAGAVYWFSGPDGAVFSRAELAEAIKGLWLQPMAGPSELASRLGFGLCLPGTSALTPQANS